MIFYLKSHQENLPLVFSYLKKSLSLHFLKDVIWSRIYIRINRLDLMKLLHDHVFNHAFQLAILHQSDLDDQTHKSLKAMMFIGLFY